MFFLNCYTFIIFIFIIIVMPWYILEAIRVPGFLHYFFITQQVTRFLGQSFNCHQPFFFYILVVFLGLLPWGIFSPQTLYVKKYTPSLVVQIFHTSENILSFCGILFFNEILKNRKIFLDRIVFRSFSSVFRHLGIELFIIDKFA